METVCKKPKYLVGDIFCLNDEPSFKRQVIYIYDIFYFDIFYPLESAYAEKEFCYRMSLCGDDNVEPSELCETVLDKYYTKFNNNYTRLP